MPIHIYTYLPIYTRLFSELFLDRIQQIDLLNLNVELHNTKKKQQSFMSDHSQTVHFINSHIVHSTVDLTSRSPVVSLQA